MQSTLRKKTHSWVLSEICQERSKTVLILNYLLILAFEAFINYYEETFADIEPEFYM
jgi:hypothetical protein